VLKILFLFLNAHRKKVTTGDFQLQILYIWKNVSNNRIFRLAKIYGGEEANAFAMHDCIV